MEAAKVDATKMSCQELAVHLAEMENKIEEQKLKEKEERNAFRKNNQAMFNSFAEMVKYSINAKVESLGVVKYKQREAQYNESGNFFSFSGQLEKVKTYDISSFCLYCSCSEDKSIKARLTSSFTNYNLPLSTSDYCFDVDWTVNCRLGDAWVFRKEFRNISEGVMRVTEKTIYFETFINDIVKMGLLDFCKRVHDRLRED